MSTSLRVARAAVLLAALAWPSAAGAQSSENKVAAEALFDQARAAMTNRKYAEACAKFEQSQRLDPGIGTLLYLADCYEKSERFASAWATFRDGASQAKQAGQTERAVAGEKRAAALEPRLSRLTIKVSADAKAIANLTVSRAGDDVAAGLWGVAVPIDGGEYRIEAKAPGHAPWTTTVRVAAEKDAATVEVPALARSAEQGPATGPAPVEPKQPPLVVPPPGPPTRDAPPGGSAQRTIGFLVGGVGLVGIGIGSYFGLRAISKNSDAKELCDGAVCREPRGETLTDEARDAAVISNIAFGAGLVALGTGVVLVLTAPSKAPDRAALRVSPHLGPRAGGLTVGGAF